MLIEREVVKKLRDLHRQVSEAALGRGQEKGDGVGDSREQSELTRRMQLDLDGFSENNYAV